MEIQVQSKGRKAGTEEVGQGFPPRTTEQRAKGDEELPTGITRARAKCLISLANVKRLKRLNTLLFYL